MTSVLLLSGGIDSTCIAAWERPQQCLGIDFGQLAARGEKRAARAVASELGLPFAHITVDASAVGEVATSGEAGYVESWPFRNQLLITLAAAWASTRGHDRVLVGTVAGDGDRHPDGTKAFLDAMNRVLRMQHDVGVSAPALELDSAKLVQVSAVSESVLSWTHSCDRSDVPCGTCASCWKRSETCRVAGILQ